MMAPFNLIVHGQSEETPGRLVGQSTTGQSDYESKSFRTGHIAGGYRLVAPSWIIRAFRRAETVLDLRVALALHELHERDAMYGADLRRDGKRRDPKHQPFSVGKIARAVRASEKRVRSSLRRLNAAKIVSWAEDGKHCSFPLLELDEVERKALEAIHARRRRPTPIPRRLIRWLAKNGTKATIAEALAVCIRCLYREKDGLTSTGRCPSRFTERVFGIGSDAVSRARGKLVGIGWIVAQTWRSEVANRHGTEVRVNLDWSPRAVTESVVSYGASESGVSTPRAVTESVPPPSPATESVHPGNRISSLFPQHPHLPSEDEKTIPAEANPNPPPAEDGLSGVEPPERGDRKKAPPTGKVDRYEPTPAPMGAPVKADPRDEPPAFFRGMPESASVSSTFRTDLDAEAEPPKPKRPLGHIDRSSLGTPDGIQELLERLDRDGWVKKSESAEIDFYSKVAHARRVADSPTALLAASIRDDTLRSNLTDEDDDAGGQLRKLAKYDQPVHREATKLVADLSDDALFVQEVIRAIERRGRRVPEGMGLFFQMARLSKGKDWIPQRLEKAKAELEFATAMDASTSAVSTVLEHTETPFLNDIDGGGERTTAETLEEVTTA